MNMIETFWNTIGSSLASFAGAPVDAGTSVPGIVAAAIAVAFATGVGIRTRRRLGAQRDVIAELSGRLAATELLLAETTTTLSALRQRTDQLISRQEATAAQAARSGLRQAIALSRHGATARQLVDTCGLSQGEAHLIQTLYGRPSETAGQGTGNASTAGGVH